MNDSTFIKRMFLGAFIWQTVKVMFRHPIASIIIITTLYFGGRYMLFNHPDVLVDGLRAVREEAVAVGSKIQEVTVESLSEKH